MSEFNNYKTEINGKTVIVLGATKEINDIIVKMVKTDSDSFGNYVLEEADEEIPSIWLEEAENDSEPDMEYIEYMENAIEDGADIYTLEDYIGDFHQTICEVIIC